MRGRARELAAEWPGLPDVLGKLADGITVEGMEAFAPVLADRMELLLDHVPAGGCVVACDPERIRARAAELVRTSQEFLEASWVNAAAGGEVPIDLGAAAFRPITEVRDAAGAAGLPWWTVTPFVADPEAGEAGGATAGPAMIPGTSIPLNSAAAAGGAAPLRGARPTLSPATRQGRETFQAEASPAKAYRGDTARVISDIRQWVADRWRVVLVTEGHGPAQRLVELLRGENLGARLDDVGDPGRAARGRRRARGAGG